MERRITTSGTIVTAHPYDFMGETLTEEQFDYAPHIEAMKAIINEQTSLGDPQFICVIGHTGTGKTMLANALHANGSNTRIIDCLAFDPTERHHDFSQLLTDPRLTYLIDSPEFLDDSIWEAIDQHTEKAGQCVCFVQDKRDFKANNPCKFVHLTRSGFTCE